MVDWETKRRPSSEEETVLFNMYDSQKHPISDLLRSRPFKAKRNKSSYLSGAKAPSSPPLAVQKLKRQFCLLHASHPDQGQQGVAGRLQCEQGVLMVGPPAPV